MWVNQRSICCCQTPCMIIRALPPLPSPPAPARLLALPARLIPGGVHSRGLALILNRILADALRNAELDFLDGRILRISVTDISLDYRLTLSKGQLAAPAPAITEDVLFAGRLKEFMLLALNREDPDTLFFQRRLQLEGDTELGLEIKNFLYTLDGEQLPETLRKLAGQLLRVLD